MISLVNSKLHIRESMPLRLTIRWPISHQLFLLLGGHPRALVDHFLTYLPPSDMKKLMVDVSIMLPHKCIIWQRSWKFWPLNCPFVQAMTSIWILIITTLLHLDRIGYERHIRFGPIAREEEVYRPLKVLRSQTVIGRNLNDLNLLHLVLLRPLNWILTCLQASFVGSLGG